jgi:hypothetical protein
MSRERFWKDAERRKTELLGEKRVPKPLCPPPFPYGLVSDWTRAFAVRGPFLNAWVMVWPLASPCMQSIVLFTYPLTTFMEYAIELRERERERGGGRKCFTWRHCHLVTLCSVDGRWFRFEYGVFLKHCWRRKPSSRTTCPFATLPTTKWMALDRTWASVETGQRLTAWTLTWRCLFYWRDP